MAKSVGYEPYGIPTHVCRGQLRCILLSNQDSSLVVLAFVILLLMFGISKSIRRSSVGEFQVSNYPLVVCQECKQKSVVLMLKQLTHLFCIFLFQTGNAPQNSGKLCQPSYLLLLGIQIYLNFVT